jgi:hypothetical protein
MDPLVDLLGRIIKWCRPYGPASEGHMRKPTRWLAKIMRPSRSIDARDLMHQHDDVGGDRIQCKLGVRRMRNFQSPNS